MNQTVLNNQNQNPLTYFANTPRSIQKRKNCASKPSNMKIINFIKNDGDGSFIVYIKGTRDIIYQVFFSEHLISCTCPDYQKHSVKPICKHMLKLVCLSENMDIFNNILLLSELMNPQYLSRILENILRIIDTKKMERYGNPTNQISIERDECCSICYADFDNNIAKCIKCSHVFHQECIRRSRAISSNFRYVGGRCPMCRELNSFPQLENYRNYDPWEIYNFPPAAQQDSPAPPAAAAQEDSPSTSTSPLAPVSAPEDPQLEEVEDRSVRQEELLLNERITNLEFEQNNEIIVFQNDLDNLPIFFENIGAAAGAAAAGAANPNQRGPAQAAAPAPAPTPNSEEQERLILDKKIKMLNISLFILNAVSIIITNISKDLSAADINPKPNQDNSSSNLI